VNTQKFGAVTSPDKCSQSPERGRFWSLRCWVGRITGLEPGRVSPNSLHSPGVSAFICGQYFALPFGQMHTRNPGVIQLARLLGRTPLSVAMKLVNLASLDPGHQARGNRGLANDTLADELR
jgi:hypothetical protein